MSRSTHPRLRCRRSRSWPTTSAAAWRTSPACPSSSTRRACGAASATASASAAWRRASTKWSKSCRCRRSRPVPGAQPWMLGVANMRGNLLPMVDLKQFLEGERTVLHESQRVLIVRQPGGDVAVTHRRAVRPAQLQRRTADRRDLSSERWPKAAMRISSTGPTAWPTSRGGSSAWTALARTPEFQQAAA